ncbi:hypothetical protein TRFO_23882 [Tritrichomonas foetus]|uniref:Uncharacterized protein n=1 Tax=Tritrichomonas foetus TaxID=1144522 RepID=A0A1J4K8F0_9EUKA|nr:hypothetical protein TRFO_23882 [Tritrichomonas foetus]|eukprot:OHT07777.1 hypothetical protein TRFO_23882 [Tritrichomonas foetus]
MLFFLSQFALCVVNHIGHGVFGKKIDFTEKSDHNFDFHKYSKIDAEKADDKIEIIISDTSFSRPLNVNLDDFTKSNIIFRSKSGTQHVHLFYEGDIITKSLTFESVFVIVSKQKLKINNLILYQSPLFCAAGQISIEVAVLTSDFLSLPATFISSVEISNHFFFIDENSVQNDDNVFNADAIQEPHAKIILLGGAKQTRSTSFQRQDKNNTISSELEKITEFLNNDHNKIKNILKNYSQNIQNAALTNTSNLGSFVSAHDFIKSLKKIQKEQESQIIHINPDMPSDLNDSDSEDHDYDSLIQFSETVEPEITQIPFLTDNHFYMEDNETNSSDPNITENLGIYSFNSTLRGISIYDDYVIALLNNADSLNLSANASQEIYINTTSNLIDISYYGNNSFFFNLNFKLLLIEECIVVFNQSFDQVSDSILQEITIYHLKPITMTSATSVPYINIIPITNVQFIPDRQIAENFCMCLKSRFSTCFENKECLLYRVPDENYFIGSNASFMTSLAKSKNEIINIYVTNSLDEEYHIIDLKPSSRSGKIYNFISASNEVRTAINLHDTGLDGSTHISLTFTDIDVTTLDVKTGILSSLTLKNSPVIVEDSFSLPDFLTDLTSLTLQQKETILVTNSLELTRGTAETIGVNIILAKNAKINIAHISYFPVIFLSTNSITFSDSNIDFTIFIEDGGPSIIEIEEQTPKINPTVSLITFSSYSNLKLHMIFKLTTSLTVSFLQALPLPENLLITFQPNEAMNTLSLIMPMDTENFPSDQKQYHFENITGNIDLVLLTPETVSSFIAALARGDFFAYNLSGFAVNLLDYLTSVTLHNNYFNMVIDNITIQISRQFVYGKLRLMTNATHVINIELAEPNMTTVPPFVIETTVDNGKIFFDDSFANFSNTNLSDLISVKHGTYNITLMTNLETVPLVQVDDSIVGVLYEGGINHFNLPENFTSFRSGPELTVNITKPSIDIYQDDFLAEKVHFYGNSFYFHVFSKSLTHYFFQNASLYFEMPNNSNTFYASSLTLRNSSFVQGVAVHCDYLNSDLHSIILRSIILFFVKFHSDIYLDDPIENILILEEGIQFVQNDKKKSSHIDGPNINIHYSGNDPISFSLANNKSLNDVSIRLFLSGGDKIIKLDKSWYNVENPKKFRIIVNDLTMKLTIRVELMKLPDIEIVDSNGNLFEFQEDLYTPVFTSKLSFMIFGTLAIIIIFISAILLIAGICCYDKLSSYEENDIQALSLAELNSSSEAEYEN